MITDSYYSYLLSCHGSKLEKPLLKISVLLFFFLVCVKEMGVDKGPFDCLQNLIDDNLCKFRVIEFEIQARGRERLGVTGRGIGAARTS